MQQLLSYSGVCTQGQGESAMRVGKPAGSLDQLAAQGFKSFELPERGALGGGFAAGLVGNHLQLPVQIVSQYGREQEDLVARECLGGDVVHLPLGFELGENAFLSPAPVVIVDHLLGADLLVGHHHLELMPVDLRDEQIQLDGAFVSDHHAVADKEEAIATIPGFGLPAQLEVIEAVPNRRPMLPLLDRALELDEALERHGNGELHSQACEQGHKSIAEKSAIHAYFDENAGQGLAHVFDAGADELLGSVGVMNIAGAMVDIEHLPGLSDCAEQRVVAALPLLQAIEAHSGAFGVAAGSNHRPIEVQSHTPQTEKGQTLLDRLPIQLSNLNNATSVGRRKQATHGGDIGQTIEPQCSLYHGVIAVVARIAQVAIAKQEVNDEAEHGQAMIVCAARVQMAEGVAQSLLQRQALEERLEQDQPGKGSQLLIFELQVGEGVDFALNLLSAKLHASGLFGLVDGVLTTPFYQSWGRFLRGSYHFLDLTRGDIQRQGDFREQTLVALVLTGSSQGFFLQLAGICSRLSKLSATTCLPGSKKSLSRLSQLADIRQRLSHLFIDNDINHRPVHVSDFFALETLEQLILQSSGEHMPAGYLNAPKADELDGETVVIDFFKWRKTERKNAGLLPEEYGAFVTRRGEPLLYLSLGPAAQIDPDIQSLAGRGQVISPEVLQRLYKHLIAPIEAQVGRPLGTAGASKLVVIPDGLITLVPFAGLVDDKAHYLVEHMTISYLNNARDLLRVGRELKPSPPVIVAKPDFDMTLGSAPLLAKRGTKPLFTPNPSFLSEAQAVAKVLKVGTDRIVTGKMAREDLLKSLAGPEILHLATHSIPNLEWLAPVPAWDAAPTASQYSRPGLGVGDCARGGE